jgi:hypothetical protein
MEKKQRKMSTDLQFQRREVWGEVVLCRCLYGPAWCCGCSVYLLVLVAALSLLPAAAIDVLFLLVLRLTLAIHKLKLNAGTPVYFRDYFSSCPGLADMQRR